MAKHIATLTDKNSRILQFELAVEAIVAGDVVRLKSLLRENPELIKARSTREHHATLLHYMGANGVEGYRQKTPKNAMKIAQVRKLRGDFRMLSTLGVEKLRQAVSMT